jgi:GT2 family glycosyltransferase
MRGAALIVLAWNQWLLTRRCLDSLLETDLDHAAIIVVDNGSADETPAAIAAYAGRVRYIRLAENQGFVRGMNTGIAAAAADDDVVLLNNDLKFTQRDWLNRLRDAAYAAPDTGVVGCRLLGPEAEGRLYHAGGFIEPDALSGQQTESGTVEREIRQFTRTRRVQGIAFALAYIRRDCLDRIGALDPMFHSYFEDTDYCLRAADAGFATVVAGGVTLQHDQHGSTQDDGGFRKRLWNASRASFAARWQQRLADDYRGTVLWQGTTRFPPPYANLARSLLRRLDARGLRMAFAPVAREVADPQDYRLDLAARRRWTHTPDAALVCAPATHFEKAHGRFRVGLCFGEWDRVPARWAETARALDLLLVPDDFQAEAFRAAGVRVPIEVLPLGVDRDYCHPRVPAPRNENAHFVFAATVSDVARDAPGELISTFRRTFGADEPVELLLYVDPATGLDASAVLALADAHEGARVRVIANWAFPDYQRAELLAAGDAYVSARRGGGWDGHAAEALACGKPLIATAFGSQAALVREHGHPVGIARLVDDPRHRGCRWAEPDAESLGARLRDVFERRDALGTSAAARAKAFAASHDLEATADRLVEKLALGGTLASPRSRVCGPTDFARPASGQIIVIGMHRSGTSSVAGLFARMGAWPGEDAALLIGPDNPRGHYELGALHGACLRRLAAAGGDWKHPPSIAPAAAVDAFRREAAAVLDTLEPRRPWFIKEPRLCLLVRELLPLLTRPVFVHVVRDPIEVVASLEARDGLGRDEALALWERYTRAAFAATRGWPRILVDYADVIADPFAASERLHGQLTALGVDGLRAPDATAIGAWIEPALRRQRASPDARAALSPAQRDLAAAIANRSILDRDFADETAVVCEASDAEAASARACG